MPELLLDVTVGGRFRRKLVESRGEQELGVILPTLTTTNETEVRDHLALVFLVAELAKEDESLLESLDRQGHAAGMNESECEVVERQRLGMPVTELANDRQRGKVLLGCPFVVPFPTQLRSKLVEPACAIVLVG